LDPFCNSLYTFPTAFSNCKTVEIHNMSNVHVNQIAA
jgi:hypothetical protein